MGLQEYLNLTGTGGAGYSRHHILHRNVNAHLGVSSDGWMDFQSSKTQVKH